MVDRRFRLVDVFGSGPLTGNPLAVVVDSDGIGTEEMLEITRWLAFSETTFLSPPESDDARYRGGRHVPAGIPVRLRGELADRLQT